MTDSISKLLDAIERLKADLKLKDVTTNELFLHHIDEKQEVKKEFFVQRRLLEQKHEEEVVRMESDILRIKVEMDQLEKQLSSLMWRSDCDNPGLHISKARLVGGVRRGVMCCLSTPGPSLPHAALPQLPGVRGEDDASPGDLSVQQRPLCV